MNLFYILLPDLLLIACGYVICQTTPINRSVWSKLDTLVYYFLFPILLFNSLIKHPIAYSEHIVFMFLVVVLISIVLLAVFLFQHVGVWLFANRPRLYVARDYAAAAQIAFRFNSFIALTLCGRIGDNQTIQLMAIVMGVAIPLCNISAVMFMRNGNGIIVLKELLKNPLLLATLLGVLCNLLSIQWPSILLPTAERIGQSALTIGLLAAGASMQLGSLQHNLFTTVTVLGFRHIVTPLLAAGIIIVFPCTPAQALVLLIFSGLPTASSSFVLAAKMGFHAQYVASLVTLSIVLSFISIPLALSFYSGSIVL